MELRHLRYFVAVAEALHFTRAAQRLGIGQPPLSLQTQQLEREIGTPLLLRLPRGVELTEAGAQLLVDARSILAAADRAIDTARRLGRGERGAVSVGFTASAVFHPYLPRAIRAYRDRYPGVHISLSESTSAALLQALRLEEVDVAFVRPPYALEPECATERVLDEPMLVALPPGHPLDRKRSVPMTDLAEEAFVLYPRPIGAGLYDAILSACLRAGFTPRVIQEAPQMASIISLVAAGVGIAIVPAAMRHMGAEGIEYRPIRGDAPRALLDMAYRRHERSTAARNAIALLRELAPTPG
ncbi:LysR family transcriptional regulator [Bordetella holmesii]|uniref:LysR substrate-binding domain protein n=1 Tax=Bordetella holmesii CDC-H585-BH TaxID=1331206 RepID=A0A158M347_9BORD|nr:LysR family transcriptional regulator [Bordetella holmesii]AHV93243.1 bacterial regulatory helix-turn-helix, lysR family protein [Bordetella holmesii ATCC 51541]EWM49194.1 bacterial regulatory helix-turn-helix, lysR family protein [Bordetella holmesii 70147]AMD46424.1 LysR family transcriptional regulator [Bordetella holmesii H558]AMD48188.1 ALS operon regulatory protein [Bordetella holmesii F627]AOB35318.1 LysR family transcriptional regulator [Bordetella holmesii]